MAIIKYTAESGGEISLSIGTVRNLIANNQNVTEEEFLLFGAMCKAHKLNPFIREAYLVKYGDKPATMVVGKDVFTKHDLSELIMVLGIICATYLLGSLAATHMLGWW